MQMPPEAQAVAQQWRDLGSEPERLPAVVVASAPVSIPDDPALVLAASADAPNAADADAAKMAAEWSARLRRLEAMQATFAAERAAVAKERDEAEAGAVATLTATGFAAVLRGFAGAVGVWPPC